MTRQSHVEFEFVFYYSMQFGLLAQAICSSLPCEHLSVFLSEQLFLTSSRGRLLLCSGTYIHHIAIFTLTFPRSVLWFGLWSLPNDPFWSLVWVDGLWSLNSGILWSLAFKLIYNLLLLRSESTNIRVHKPYTGNKLRAISESTN